VQCRAAPQLHDARWLPIASGYAHTHTHFPTPWTLLHGAVSHRQPSSLLSAPPSVSRCAHQGTNIFDTAESQKVICGAVPRHPELHDARWLPIALGYAHIHTLPDAMDTHFFTVESRTASRVPSFPRRPRFPVVRTRAPTYSTPPKSFAVQCRATPELHDARWLPIASGCAHTHTLPDAMDTSSRWSLAHASRVPLVARCVRQDISTLDAVASLGYVCLAVCGVRRARRFFQQSSYPRST
jgi:8-oxo-dGTP pyrophosphatase MutT (NUDIX family)